MRLLRYLRSRAALLAELETLRAENAALRDERDMWRLISWVRRHPSPKALLLPDQKPAPTRTDPHVVHLGRHHRADPTEVHPRRSR